MESVGGRLEPDGRFLGTRWRTLMLEREGEEEENAQREATPSTPSDADVAAVNALVLEVVRRAAR